MTIPWLISYVFLWGLVLGTGFLLLGTLRSLGQLQWRFDELDAARPVRKGREGLPPGKPAPGFTLPAAAEGTRCGPVSRPDHSRRPEVSQPSAGWGDPRTTEPDFTLPGAAGGDISLSDFLGRKLLLVFTQSGCGPCHAIAPELNRLHAQGRYPVLVVNNGEPHETQAWADEIQARFRVVTQEDWQVSKQYQVFATPYAFVVDEQGVIAAKGIATTPQYLRYLFDAAEKYGGTVHDVPERDSAIEREPVSSLTSKEVMHV